MLTLTDKFGRTIHDLRISITDRCNYRCVYCRTGTNGAAFAELPFADYLRMARILVGLGITKIRLTGGEPLLRNGIVEFVRDLSNLRTIQGAKPEIALTTNGHLLAEIAGPLKDAGLDRVTVSMDAVDPDRFARITRASCTTHGREKWHDRLTSRCGSGRRSRQGRGHQRGCGPVLLILLARACNGRSQSERKTSQGALSRSDNVKRPRTICS